MRIADGYLRQGARHLKGTYSSQKRHIFLWFLGYFLDFGVIFEFFGQILRFLIKITWVLSFSGKNDAESLCHFVKNLILNPKHAKFNQKSWFSHVRTCKVVIWTCPDLKSRDLDMSGPEKSWFGHVWPVLTSKQRKYFYFLRFYTFPFFMTSTYFKTAEILFFWDFTPFHFLLANLSFLSKIMCF